MDQAETILAAAMESKQHGAAVSALKEKGILSGKRVERAEIGEPGEFDRLTDDELEHLIHERILQGPNVVFGPKTKQ